MIIRNQSSNPIIFVIGLMFFAVFIIGSFYLASWIFDILKFITPVLLVATAIINYRVLLNYGKWLVTSLKNNLFMGIIYIAFTVIGFPFVAGWLFIKALLGFFIKRKINEIKEEKEGQFIEYEEVDSEIMPEKQLRQDNYNNN